MAGDARVHLDVLLKTEVEVIELKSHRDWDKAKFAAALAGCLVDALVGTGFRGEIDGSMAELVKIINTAGKLVVAVDMPSGVDADTGQVRGIAVQASHTVTFGLPKPGLLLQPGASLSGEVTVADIGIPVEILRTDTIKQNVITAEYVRHILPRRQPGLIRDHAAGRWWLPVLGDLPAPQPLLPQLLSDPEPVW